jgi:hypothetical protein
MVFNIEKKHFGPQYSNSIMFLLLNLSEKLGVTGLVEHGRPPQW